MTTYVVSFTLPAAETNTGSQYPILVGDSTYLPECTIFVKAGDTIRYTVTEPEGGNVIYQNTSNHDTDPDPDGFDEDTMNYQVKSSPGSWEYTVGTGNEDKFFTWFFYGSTPATNTANRKYSQRVQTVRVDGAPRMNYSTSAITVDQGGTINFSISGMGMYHQDNGAQLDSAANVNKNKLYFAIFNAASSGSLINPTSYTGGGWDSSTNQLGGIYTSDQQTTLTIGSNMPTGTYYVYLTHYNSVGLASDLANSGSSPAGNRFYGAANRLSSTALQFTVQAPTGTVSGLSLGDDVSTTNLNFEVIRNSGTITCSPTTFEPSVSVSNGSFKRKNGSGVVQDASWQTSSATIQNGWSVDFKMTGPDAYEDSETGTLTIAEDADSLVVTTSEDPGSGSGGSEGGGTSGTRGLRILDSNGKVLFGDGRKMGNQIGADSITTPLAHNTFSNYYEMVGVPHADGISERTGITIIDTYSGTSNINPLWVVERHGSGINGHFAWRVKHITAVGVSRPYNYIVFRY